VHHREEGGGRTGLSPAARESLRNQCTRGTNAPPCALVEPLLQMGIERVMIFTENVKDKAPPILAYDGVGIGSLGGIIEAIKDVTSGRCWGSNGLF